MKKDSLTLEGFFCGVAFFCSIGGLNLYKKLGVFRDVLLILLCSLAMSWGMVRNCAGHKSCAYVSHNLIRLDTWSSTDCHHVLRMLRKGNSISDPYRKQHIKNGSPRWNEKRHSDKAVLLRDDLVLHGLHRACGGEGYTNRCRPERIEHYS